MIIETLVSTLNQDNTVNLAPMGPDYRGDWERFELRPFDTSRTCQNLLRTRQGVLHLTDDVLLFARSAVNAMNELPPLRPATEVVGSVLTNACRWFEFQVIHIDASQPRLAMQCQTVKTGRGREFEGFNRARHAIIEAAIIATRIDFLPKAEIDSQFDRCRIIVEKTGGLAETAAFEILEQYVYQRVESHES